MLWSLSGFVLFFVAHFLYIVSSNHDLPGSKEFWDVTPLRILGFVAACIMGPLTLIAVFVTLVIAIMEFKDYAGVKLFNLRDWIKDRRNG